ncbi:gliding motility protein GldN [Pedobacter sp. SYP-B3415]|uniref:type IX secretion system ring protein PorN/GldN n=1 Tax=Pedobacter sp. SYP-B3415 TaxID=2496641 RepID=UPI00101B79A8|nr:gliding motility protein GldN [Pedobacter sp. SYP-B3415]
MKTKGIFLVPALLLLCQVLFAQKPDEKTSYGYYGSLFLNGQVIDYVPLAEEDVLFSKRLWRTLDTKDTVNWSLLAPQSKLSDIMMNALKEGELTAYDVPAGPSGSYFSKVLNNDQIIKKLSDSIFVPQYDKDGNQIGGRMMQQDFNPDQIKKYMIMEDWVFDRNRGVFEARILGIAPLLSVRAGGEEIDDYVPFWVYFPELRYILATRKVALFENDASQWSYDDWFMKRRFNGRIYKISNPLDVPLDVMYQGQNLEKVRERIDRELMSRLELLMKEHNAAVETPDPVQRPVKGKAKNKAPRKVR